MGSVTWEGDLRRHARQLGCEIRVQEFPGPQYCFIIEDPDLGGRRFSVLCRPNAIPEGLRILHETVYHARGREKFRQQGGLCALCGRRLNGSANTETDHKLSRGAHGRDDRITNLRAVHAACHRVRHGQGRK